MAQTGSQLSGSPSSDIPIRPERGHNTYISASISAYKNAYVGRFAPSPSGPLHMGSLLAALASYLDARSSQGTWLVRMEDLDPPREQPGASTLILKQLETLGLTWDGEVLFQSTRHEAYREAVATLKAQGKIYYCTCSRQQLQKYNGIYPGFCRERQSPLSKAAIRCLIRHNSHFEFCDLFQGQQSMSADDEGDVVIVRRDGLFAYQLAVVVDDAFQGISHVVRGIDLLDSTARQHYLQQLLQYPELHYAHLPVLVDQQGQKLSKQQGASALDTDQPGQTLYQALLYLKQNPPSEIVTCSAEEVLEWGIANWKPEALRGQHSISMFVPPKSPAL